MEALYKSEVEIRWSRFYETQEDYPFEDVMPYMLVFHLGKPK